MISASLLSEIEQYLHAASDGSMSRNNSEQLASELLDRIREEKASPTIPPKQPEPTL